MLYSDCYQMTIIVSDTDEVPSISPALASSHVPTVLISCPCIFTFHASLVFVRVAHILIQIGPLRRWSGGVPTTRGRPVDAGQSATVRAPADSRPVHAERTAGPRPGCRRGPRREAPQTPPTSATVPVTASGNASTARPRRRVRPRQRLRIKPLRCALATGLLRRW